MAGVALADTAKVAVSQYEASRTVARGMTGRAYAIPTRGTALETLSLDEIRQYVRTFTQYAADHPKKHFLISRIGISSNSYLEYGEKAIAQLFAEAGANCEIPNEWARYLEK